MARSKTTARKQQEPLAPRKQGKGRVNPRARRVQLPRQRRRPARLSSPVPITKQRRQMRRPTSQSIGDNIELDLTLEASANLCTPLASSPPVAPAPRTFLA